MLEHKVHLSPRLQLLQMLYLANHFLLSFTDVEFCTGLALSSGSTVLSIYHCYIVTATNSSHHSSCVHILSRGLMFARLSAHKLFSGVNKDLLN